MLSPPRKPTYRAAPWAQGLLLVLLGLVVGTMIVLLVGPRPCAERVERGCRADLRSEARPAAPVDEAPESDIGVSVADDSWGALGP